MGNLHRTARHTQPEEFAVLAGKGEFMLHGLIGGAAGSIAALVNMFVPISSKRSYTFTLKRALC